MTDAERDCRDALDDAGSSLEHSDDLNLASMRDAASRYVAECASGETEVDASLVENLVDVLDDATIVSDDPAADAVVVIQLLELVGVRLER